MGCFGCLGVLALIAPFLFVALAFVWGASSALSGERGMPRYKNPDTTAFWRAGHQLMHMRDEYAAGHGGIRADTRIGDMLHHLDYEDEVDDYRHEALQLDCGQGETLQCLALDTGAVLMFAPAQSFGGTTDKHYVTFTVDPDGEGPAEPGSLLIFAVGPAFNSGEDYAIGTPGPDGIPVVRVDPPYVEQFD